MKRFGRQLWNQLPAATRAICTDTADCFKPALKASLFPWVGVMLQITLTAPLMNFLGGWGAVTGCSNAYNINIIGLRIHTARGVARNLFWEYKFFGGGIKLQYSCSIAVLTLLGIYIPIYPPSLRPCILHLLIDSAQRNSASYRRRRGGVQWFVPDWKFGCRRRR